jgi:hypothetical protein
LGIEAILSTRSGRATPATHDDTIETFAFPAIGRKKVTAAFDGDRLTSYGGVILVAAAERRIGLAPRLAALIADPRNRCW